MATTPDDRRRRVLIVEDEALIALETTGHLRDWGYEVCGIAASVGDALRKAESARPDLALVDVNLGVGGDGVDAARALQDEYGAPVVFVTAQSDPASCRRMATVEPAGCVFKPYDPSTLRRVMAGALA